MTCLLQGVLRAHRQNFKDGAGSPGRPRSELKDTHCVLSRRGVDSSELAYGGSAGFLGSLACQGWSLPKKPVEKGG